MQHIYNTTNIIRSHQSVVILGNFDGVHIAHQKLFKVAQLEAESRNLQTIVFSFYPHPTWVIGKHPKSLLMSREDKKKMIQKMNIDVLIEYPFTIQFANIEPEAFFKEILIEKLKTQVLVVGSNYYFGKDKKGNPELLKTLGRHYGVTVHVVEAVMQEKRAISSSRIRELILDGAIEKANHLLGHPYKITGEVIKGKQLGRTIGFPTINIVATKDRVYPPNGVYATKVKVYSKTYMGMTNIGVNPTVAGERKMIETHLLDCNEDLYGAQAEVYFYHFIRPETKFETLDGLKEQIIEDKEEIKQFFYENPNLIAKE